MVVCKFFLQGNCKFGDHCKFEHQINDNYYRNQNQQHSSILRQPHFSSNQYQTQHINSAQAVQAPKDNKQTGNVDLTTLVKAVANDMIMAEKGGQWLLSCYSPFKDKPLFPGFDDHSFEEVRLGYYDAKIAGSLEQYKQQINGTLQQTIMRVKALQNPSAEIVEIIKNIYNTPVQLQKSTQNSPNPFENAGNSTFTQGQSIFAQANQNLFTQNKQVSNSGGSIFANPTASSNIFAAQPNANNAFNINQNVNTGNIFASQGNNQIMFGQNPTGPTFVNQTTNAGGSIFTAQTTNPVSTFNQPQNTNIFAQSQSIFAQQQQQQQQMAVPEINSGNIFATPFNPQQSTHTSGMEANSGNVFGKENMNVASGNGSLYSRREDLTEDEIKWFETNDLDISRIPEKPPTYDMCYKT